MKEQNTLAAALNQALEKQAFVEHMAFFDKKTTVMSNITDALINEDKTKMLRYMNCDEKYNNRQASDFELFAEWERVFALCPGTGVAEWYREELKFLGLDDRPIPRSREELCERWKKGNEEWECLFLGGIMACCAGLHLTRFVSNFINTHLGEKMEFSILYQSVYERITNENLETITVDLSSMIYDRPDLYHSALAFERVLHGEKSYNSDWFMIVSQLLISLITGWKSKKKLQLHIYAQDSYSVAEKLLEYLEMRNLLSNCTIRLGIFVDRPVREWIGMCERAEGRIKVTPEWILRPQDFGYGLSDNMMKIYSEYPIAGIRFGGILTDSPLFMIGHRLFKRHLADCLSLLCDSYDQAMGILQELF